MALGEFKPSGADIVLGSGTSFFRQRIDGVLAATWRKLAQSESLQITSESASVTVDDVDDPIHQRIRDISTTATRSGSVVLRDISPANLALHLVGETSTVTQTSDSVTAEEHDSVKQGQYVQIGESLANPFASQKITNLVVKDDQGTPTTFTESDDYTLQAETGMLYIVPGGAISDGTNLRLDYDRGAASYEMIKTAGKEVGGGQFLYLADNTEGHAKDILIPDMVLRPDGAVDWKSQTEIQKIPLGIAINKPNDQEQVYIRERLVAA